MNPLEKAQKYPVKWLEEIAGIKTLGWPQHREILNAFVDNDRITVRSGHSMGKDFIGGIAALQFLQCFKNSVVITTAPTERQVEKILWGEISKYFNSSIVPLAGKLTTTQLKISETWYAIGFTTKDTQSIGKFQGLKGKHVLVIVTEAQAVEDEIFDQIEGIMTADNSKLYFAGNPLRSEGYFYKSFSDPTFKKFSFSCYDSPNYIAGKEVIPGMVGRKWVEDKERRWGKDSPLFQARVLGEFPKQSKNSLISISALEKALEATPEKGYKVLGIDPARFGDDMTCFADVTGGKINSIEQFQGLATPEVEGRAIALMKEKDYDKVIVDEGAMGAGIFDHLEEAVLEINLDRKRKREILLSTEVIPFGFGSRPFDDKFANLGTDAYFWACELIEQGKVKVIEDQDFFSQIASRKYKFNQKGKMILESKEDIKKRGMPSPDAADAVVMALWHGIDEDYKTREEQEEDFNEESMECEPVTGYPKYDKREVFV